MNPPNKQAEGAKALSPMEKNEQLVLASLVERREGQAQTLSRQIKQELIEETSQEGVQCSNFYDILDEGKEISQTSSTVPILVDLTLQEEKEKADESTKKLKTGDVMDIDEEIVGIGGSMLNESSSVPMDLGKEKTKRSLSPAFNGEEKGSMKDSSKIAAIQAKQVLPVSDQCPSADQNRAKNSNLSQSQAMDV